MPRFCWDEESCCFPVFSDLADACLDVKRALNLYKNGGKKISLVSCYHLFEQNTTRSEKQLTDSQLWQCGISIIY